MNLRLDAEAKLRSMPMGGIIFSCALDCAISEMGATPAEGVPGLWNVPGYAELTTNQLLQIAAAKSLGRDRFNWTP